MSKISFKNSMIVEDNDTKFKLLFDSLYIGITYQNTLDKITDVSPTSLKILGLTKDKIQK